MMPKLGHVKLVFVVIGLVGVLLFASPLAGSFVSLPAGERFSEFYVLGSGRMLEDYPFAVKPGESYTVYLGVVNHLGASGYYLVNVKLRNQLEPLPNSTSGVPSSLEPLSEYRVFLADGATWEAPLTLAVDDVSVADDVLTLGSLVLNGDEFVVEKQARWDGENSGFYFELFAELWRYDGDGGLRFDSRYVHLWLNVTAAV
jgi:uncharacterized membrane protein